MGRRGYDNYYYQWPKYAPVAQRRAQARKYAAKLAKKGRTLLPVEIEGRAIARTFWGKAWCDNLESYSDFENRLPRGRTYVRNGSVLDLQITGGKVTAMVSGSEIYNIQIKIAPLANTHWKSIKRQCSQSIDSLIDLLQGRLSQGVMERLTRQKEGLFPQPDEIQMRCSCPDWAVLCKHVAAALYGVGARLDSDPQMLFTLRQVDHLELIRQAVDGENLDAALSAGAPGALDGEDLGQLFGIELDTGSGDSGSAGAAPAARKAGRTRSVTIPTRLPNGASKGKAARTGRTVSRTSGVASTPETAKASARKAPATESAASARQAAKTIRGRKKSAAAAARTRRAKASAVKTR